MTETANFLSVLGEIRGRIDELEHMLRFANDYAVPSPRAHEDANLQILTPPVWKELQTSGLPEAVIVERYTRVNDFIQFGTPSKGEHSAQVTTFELSELHRRANETKYGLRIVPSGKRPEWFTYEFAAGELDLSKYAWTEWILKISLDEPTDVFFKLSFYLAGEEIYADIGKKHVNEFASFIHLTLPRKVLLDKGMTGAGKLRLIMSTSSKLVPINLYAFSIYGKHEKLE